MQKTCSKCGNTYPIEDFYNNRSNPDGKQYFCKTCFKSATTASRLKNRSTYLYNHTRINADRRGIDFTLTKDWFAERVASGKCELTGIDFVLDQKRHPFLPSPDRIDTQGPYSAENCRMVLWMINCAKGTTEDSEFRLAFLRVAEAMREQG